MRFSDGSKVKIICIVEPFKPAMYKYVMNKKITNTVEQNSKSNVGFEVPLIYHAKHNE